MKITRGQLRRIIREELERSHRRALREQDRGRLGRSSSGAFADMAAARPEAEEPEVEEPAAEEPDETPDEEKARNFAREFLELEAKYPGAHGKKGREFNRESGDLQLEYGVGRVAHLSRTGETEIVAIRVSFYDGTTFNIMIEGL
jgi:hypothetical protein